MITYFQHNKISTAGNHLVGTVWTFRNCVVEMFNEGLSCTCKTKHTTKCNHVKSVELGILGVGQKYYK